MAVVGAWVASRLVDFGVGPSRSGEERVGVEAAVADDNEEEEEDDDDGVGTEEEEDRVAMGIEVDMDMARCVVVEACRLRDASTAVLPLAGTRLPLNQRRKPPTSVPP
jgi:hypothetical protein